LITNQCLGSLLARHLERSIRGRGDSASSCDIWVTVPSFVKDESAKISFAKGDKIFAEATKVL
jgi:hypothetical protein